MDVTENGHTLAQAIVDTIREPLLVLDADLRVVAAGRAFYEKFETSSQSTLGRLLYELNGGQWDLPALRTLLEEVIPQDIVVEGYEVEHNFPTIGWRTLRLNARTVFYQDSRHTTLLLAIEDITEQRAAEREKNELLRQKDVLLQEMRHRIANSLQIIASILSLKAHTVQSEETRQHLQDAHQLVMSVATVQQHLQPSGLGDEIAIGPYLSKLCDSLAASMIGDRRPVSLKVQANGGTARSDRAVCLGLITTELVINGLKHAFPGTGAGQIIVAYEAEEVGPGWRLSVSDNGVGRSEGNDDRKRCGLGTSIVKALANQLDARVEITGGPSGGMTVSIIHAV